MSYRRPSFWAALAIIAAAVIAVSIIYLGIVRLPFILINVLGVANSPVHWLGWIGSILILVTTVAYSLMKRARHRASGSLLKFHAFGNLLGFVLISIHFISQVTRPASSYPVLGTGIVLYSAMLILVVTGFLAYFAVRPGWVRYYKWLHPAAAFTLVMVIIVHIIHGI